MESKSVAVGVEDLVMERAPEIAKLVHLSQPVAAGDLERERVKGTNHDVSQLHPSYSPFP